MGQPLNITVKEALEHTLGKGFAEHVTLRVDGNDTPSGCIGEADDYKNALIIFGEFLDARVVTYKWGEKDGKNIADIIVSEDDTVIVKVTNDNQVSFRVFRDRSKETNGTGITTLREALAEIERLKRRAKANNESYAKLEKKNNELQKENRILERENFELHERLNNQGLVAMSALANVLSTPKGFVSESEFDALKKENDRLRSEMSWEWENNLQEERRKNERGEQGIYG